MQWEHLTASDFEKAVTDTQVCILALGVVEKHSEHLPLGTDFLSGHRIACLAAERESAVVFPPFYFGQIYEALCFPGTITLKPTLLIDLLTGVLDEIGRNGFRKIILYNAHGGNEYLLGFLTQCALWKEKPYVLYAPSQRLTEAGSEIWKSIVSSDFGGHACEQETSMVLGTFPDLVQMERIPEKSANPRNRLDHLPRLMTGIWWYADYPDHYAGDARQATPEKGKILIDLMVDCLVEYIVAVKADKAVPALSREFFERAKQIGIIPDS